MTSQNNTKKSSKMAPTWLQNEAKLELSWAPESFGPVLGPLKSEDRTETENNTKNTAKNTPNRGSRPLNLDSKRTGKHICLMKEGEARTSGSLNAVASSLLRLCFAFASSLLRVCFVFPSLFFVFASSLLRLCFAFALSLFSLCIVFASSLLGTSTRFARSLRSLAHLPKVKQKSSPDRSKNDPKTIPNRSQNGPKSINIAPKSIQNRFWGRPRPNKSSRPLNLPFWDRFGSVLGPLLAASWGSSWGQVGPKIDFWRSWMAFKNEHDAGYLSEPIFGRFWGRFWGPKSIPNRFLHASKIMFVFERHPGPPKINFWTNLTPT